MDEPVEALRVQLVGRRVSVRENWTGVRPGTRLRLEIPVPEPGSYALDGDLVARFPGGAVAEMPLSFEVQSLAPLEIRAEASPESVEEGQLRVVATDGSELARYELALYGRAGAPLGRDQGRVGTRGEIRWAPPEEAVLRIVLTVYDARERYREVTLYPWRVDIPHEEVLFPTGSSDLRPSETPKLQETLSRLQAALADYGRWAPVQLFIAGHTDTVGSGESNLALSRYRARSIARWFRDHGVQVPIFFAGFGERQLAVKTPDETEEAKNRRAEYIIAVDPPELPAGAPSWIRVP